MSHRLRLIVLIRACIAGNAIMQASVETISDLPTPDLLWQEPRGPGGFFQSRYFLAAGQRE